MEIRPVRNTEELIGSRARVSEVLSRRRSVGLGMTRRLQSRLGIPADVLTGTVATAQPARIRLRLRLWTARKAS